MRNRRAAAAPTISQHNRAMIGRTRGRFDVKACGVEQRHGAVFAPHQQHDFFVAAEHDALILLARMLQSSISPKSNDRIGQRAERRPRAERGLLGDQPVIFGRAFPAYPANERDDR